MYTLADYARPSATDVAVFGVRRARAYCAIRLANALVFGLGFALAVTSHLVPDVSATTGSTHWPPGIRHLAIVDRTGDPAWQEATRWAVDRWNEADTGFRLTWSTGTGPCRYEGARVGVCGAERRTLGSLGRIHLEALVNEKVGDESRKQAAMIRVCADCDLDAARRRVVMAHEVGHVLGLDHDDRPESVMFSSGGPDRPDSRDAARLREKARRS